MLSKMAVVDKIAFRGQGAPCIRFKGDYRRFLGHNNNFCYFKKQPIITMIILMKLMSGQGPLCSQKGLKMIKNIFSLLKNEKILDDSFDSKFRNLDRQLSVNCPRLDGKNKKVFENEKMTSGPSGRLIEKRFGRSG